MALAGVAAAEDWTATFTTSNTSKDQAYTDYSAAFAEGCPLTMDITNMVITGTANNQVNGSYAANAGNNTTSIRPNANIGNGGTYTITFKLTNTSDDVIILDQIAFESFAYNSTGSLQSYTDNVQRNVTFTLSGGIEGAAPVLYTASGVDNVTNSDAAITFTPIELTQNAYIEFSLKVAKDDGCQGTFVGLTGATFSGEIVAPVTPDTPAVPEPATATLSLLALAGLAARRRRK